VKSLPPARLNVEGGGKVSAGFPFICFLIAEGAAMDFARENIL
jgi:hypothetical protein